MLIWIFQLVIPILKLVEHCAKNIKTLEDSFKKEMEELGYL